MGIFGSTFDPPHFAHLLAAQWSLEALNLDFILMIPASINPLKQEHIPAQPQLRLEMVNRAVEGCPHFLVSDVELQRAGVSYMVDTIMELRRTYTVEEYKFYLLLGADVANDFHLWRSPRELSELTTLAVFNRPGYDFNRVMAKLPDSASAIKIPELEISSTLIRERVKSGKSIEFMVPPSVISIIDRENLYRN